MAKTWQVKALTISGKGTERVENGLRIYTPPKAEWKVIREFDSPAKADEWLMDYIRSNGLNCTDFNIVRK